MSIRSAAYLVNRFLLGRTRLTATADHFDLRFRVRTRDVIGRHIYKYGSHERETTEFLIRSLDIRDGDVVFDIGANIGWYSLILDRIADQAAADIYAFEPDPENFGLLEENVALNDARHVLPLELGVSDRAGSIELYLFGGSNRGRHSMLPIHDGECIEVRTVTLDGFWVEQGLGERRPAFIKMDIEGFELTALRGASGVLARCPLVMLEYSPRYMQAAGLEPPALLALMDAAGFEPRVLESGSLKPADPAALATGERHVDLFWQRRG